jgi:hypothetical protein
MTEYYYGWTVHYFHIDFGALSNGSYGYFIKDKAAEASV